MSHDPQPTEQRSRRRWSRHEGRRRWVTYSGYMAAAVGLVCLAVHIFAGWRLVSIDAMLPTYLWIVTVILLLVGAATVLVNEGARSLDGAERVAFGQVVSEQPQADGPRRGRGKQEKNEQG